MSRNQKEVWEWRLKKNGLFLKHVREQYNLRDLVAIPPLMLNLLRKQRRI